MMASIKTNEYQEENRMEKIYKNKIICYEKKENGRSKLKKESLKENLTNKNK